MSQPRVTIVLPVYNGERFLRESIESCLTQTYADLELIAVDDGSTDSTPAILAEHAARDPRMRIITNETNRNLPCALNKGFGASRGAFLTWIACDNRFRVHAIQTMVDVLQRKPEIDIVYADYSLMDSDGRPYYYRAVPEYRELLSWPAMGGCFLYRRRVQDEIGPYAEDLFMAEDHDFWLRASLRCRMEPIHEDLYLYRVHDKSLTLSRRHHVRAATDRCLERNLPSLTWATAPERAAVYLDMARNAQLRGEARRACRFGITALRLAPLRTVYLFLMRLAGYWRRRATTEDPG
jgi:glycosyltransferase involved in cell wall biosynthesis